MKAIFKFFHELFTRSPEDVELWDWAEKQDADTRSRILSMLWEKIWDDFTKWWRR